MLKDQMWFDFCDALLIELKQSADEGRETEELRAEAEKIHNMDKTDPERQILGAALYEKLESAPMRADYGFEEPNGLKEISAAAKGIGNSPAPQGEALYQKIYGAWIARCAGCLLGQPVEGWVSARIQGLLRESGNMPLKGYLSSDLPKEVRKRYGVVDEGHVYGGSKINWINNVSYMPEDDDTNYTILALKLMEEKGFSFTPDDVAECWLANLPILHVCTAERVAYCNLVNRIYPPSSASFRNAYREYIGAQIRGDLFGYVCPGNPELAAELAFRDASISHVKNGIYGEMMVAAMLAQAAVSTDIENIVEAGLAVIPQKSRLYGAVSLVLSWRRAGKTAQEALRKVSDYFNEADGYHWCHTIPNAMIVCIGLLFGGGDFDRVMELCLVSGFDTDCNCATAGSVWGMAYGAEAIPEKWTAPLNDRVRSGVDGFGLERISSLARRTLRLAEES